MMWVQKVKPLGAILRGFFLVERELEVVIRVSSSQSGVLCDAPFGVGFRPQCAGLLCGRYRPFIQWLHLSIWIISTSKICRSRAAGFGRISRRIKRHKSQEI